MTVRVHDDWLLTPHRLAIHEPTGTAVIADVHLGYREARQDAGDAIPLLSVREQLAPLRLARQRHGFSKLLVAGDLFERTVREDLLGDFLTLLQSLGVAFAGLVPGNHDRGWQDYEKRIPMHARGVVLGDWRVVHGDAPALDARHVLGHWHPVVQHGRRRVPCYLVGPRELVLPAFTQDAAGVNVAASRRWAAARRFGIVGNRVLEMP